jgi:hypothetical protein
MEYFAIAISSYCFQKYFSLDVLCGHKLWQKIWHVPQPSALAINEGIYKMKNNLDRQYHSSEISIGGFGLRQSSDQEMFRFRIYIDPFKL